MVKEPDGWGRDQCAFAASFVRPVVTPAEKLAALIDGLDEVATEY